MSDPKERLGVGQGSTLDWSTIKFRQKLTDEEWYGLDPDARIAAQLREWLNGRTPFDKP